jgi:putative ABC transport system permease protein
MRAMGASNTYIYKVIICQALLNAVIGFAIAALIGTAIAHFTSKSAVQIVITRNLMIELFVLTVAMTSIPPAMIGFKISRNSPD